MIHTHNTREIHSFLCRVRLIHDGGTLFDRLSDLTRHLTTLSSPTSSVSDRGELQQALRLIDELVRVRHTSSLGPVYPHVTFGVLVDKLSLAEARRLAREILPLFGEYLNHPPRSERQMTPLTVFPRVDILCRPSP